VSAHDGHTINVGPVTVHADVPAIDRHAHRPWDGTPADLDAERADACRCGPEYYERGLIAPDCSADAIFDLCDEVDRLRAENTALRRIASLAAKCGEGWGPGGATWAEWMQTDKELAQAVYAWQKADR